MFHIINFTSGIKLLNSIRCIIYLFVTPGLDIHCDKYIINSNKLMHANNTKRLLTYIVTFTTISCNIYGICELL
jgi:hypothetical protein